jgi:tetratricopeptide (TPR) repeat protein
MNTEKSIKKKLRIVLISFMILLLPLGYFIRVSFVMDKTNRVYQNAIEIGGQKNILAALNQIDKARSFIFWDIYMLHQKAQLLYKLKKYRRALETIKHKDNFIYQGLLYEHLEETDSAKICYKKAIVGLKKALRKQKDNIYLYSENERRIALMYAFLNDSVNSKKYLKQISSELDFFRKDMILRYDYYIDSYKSGGYKDFIEGETIYFNADSIPIGTDKDSLFRANRFYYNSYSGNQYEIKALFEDKALLIGMQKINNETQQAAIEHKGFSESW